MVWFPVAQGVLISENGILASYRREIPLNNVKYMTYLAVRKKYITYVVIRLPCNLQLLCYFLTVALCYFGAIIILYDEGSR